MSSFHLGHEWITIYCGRYPACNWSNPIALYCGNRFCSTCGKSRHARTRRRIEWMTSNIKIPSGCEFRLLTLTIRSESSLHQMVHHLIHAFRALRQTKFWKSHVVGGCYVIELTRGDQPGFWHAHIHSIILNRFFDITKMFPIWKSISVSSHIHIDRIPLRSVVTYLTKYLTKTTLSESCQTEAAVALKGSRLFTPFGSFYASARGCPKIKPCCPICGNTGLFQIDFGLDLDVTFDPSRKRLDPPPPVPPHHVCVPPPQIEAF